MAIQLEKITVQGDVVEGVSWTESYKALAQQWEGVCGEYGWDIDGIITPYGLDITCRERTAKPIEVKFILKIENVTTNVIPTKSPVSQRLTFLVPLPRPDVQFSIVRQSFWNFFRLRGSSHQVVEHGLVLRAENKAAMDALLSCGFTALTGLIKLRAKAGEIKGTMLRVPQNEEEIKQALDVLLDCRERL